MSLRKSLQYTQKCLSCLSISKVEIKKIGTLYLMVTNVYCLQIANGVQSSLDIYI